MELRCNFEPQRSVSMCDLERTWDQSSAKLKLAASGRQAETK
jgi:hypothetical protein